MGRYYHLVKTFFHERKNEIFLFREARKVFGYAEKEKKEGEFKSSSILYGSLITLQKAV